ncbi:MAG: hypothetical protein ACRYGC_13855 [Janthinobacterium lividum]
MSRSALLPVLAVLLVPAMGGLARAQATHTVTRHHSDGTSVSTRGKEPAGHTGPMTAAPISPLSNTPSPSAGGVGMAGTTAGSGTSGASASVGSSAGGPGALGLGGLGGTGFGGGVTQNTLGEGAGAGGGPAGGSAVGANMNTK